jgi:hypothetical protein
MLRTLLITVGVCASVPITEWSAEADDCTLPEEAIMALDYNMSSFYPYMTAKLSSKKLIPGQGVEYQIHYLSTASEDRFFYLVSDTKHGSGAVAGVDVSPCDKFDLRFTLVSIDDSTTATGTVMVGSVVGDTPGKAFDRFRPEEISLPKDRRNSVVSSTPVNGATNYVMGFTAQLMLEFSDGPHDIVLRVQPADLGPPSSKATAP